LFNIRILLQNDADVNSFFVFVGAEKAFMPQDAVYTRILGHLLS